MAKLRFKIQWYADDVIKAIREMTYEEEKAAGERIIKRVKKNVPVGKRIVAAPFRGKSWQSRYPGRLKASIRLKKSKYRGGGFVAIAGDDYNIYYAHWVEYGTIFMMRRKGYKYMRNALKAEKSLFTRRLRKRLGV